MNDATKKELKTIACKIRMGAVPVYTTHSLGIRVDLFP